MGGVGSAGDRRGSAIADDAPSPLTWTGATEVTQQATARTKKAMPATSQPAVRVTLLSTTTSVFFSAGDLVCMMEYCTARWPSRPIRSLRYIVTCTRIRALSSNLPMINHLTLATLYFFYIIHGDQSPDYFLFQSIIKVLVSSFRFI